MVRARQGGTGLDQVFRDETRSRQRGRAQPARGVKNRAHGAAFARGDDLGDKGQIGVAQGQGGRGQIGAARNLAGRAVAVIGEPITIQIAAEIGDVAARQGISGQRCIIGAGQTMRKARCHKGHGQRGHKNQPLQRKNRMTHHDG